MILQIKINKLIKNNNNNEKPQDRNRLLFSPPNLPNCLFFFLPNCLHGYPRSLSPFLNHGVSWLLRAFPLPRILAPTIAVLPSLPPSSIPLLPPCAIFPSPLHHIISTQTFCMMSSMKGLFIYSAPSQSRASRKFCLETPTSQSLPKPCQPADAVLVWPPRFSRLLLCAPQSLK